MRQLVSANVERAVHERDGEICRYCGRTGLVLDHVVPVSRSGRTDVENLVLACAICNAAKHDRTPVEAGLFLFTPMQALRLALFRAQLIAESAHDLFGETPCDVAGARALLEMQQRKVDWEDAV